MDDASSMLVGELMTREVRTCRPEDSLKTAARLLWEEEIGFLPVVDAGGHLAGVITDRDICMAAYTSGRPLADLPVGRCMTRVVFAIRPERTVADAELLMCSKHVHRLPVVDEAGRVVGVLSLDDLARETALEQTQPGRLQRIPPAEVAMTLAAVAEHRVQTRLQVPEVDAALE